MKDANNEQICRMFSFHSDGIAIISVLSILAVNSIKVVENLNLILTTKGVSEKIRQKKIIQKIETIGS